MKHADAETSGRAETPKGPVVPQAIQENPRNADRRAKATKATARTKKS